MTLTEIYDTYRRGSTPFCGAVQTHCGLDISESEIERIANNAATAREFETIWEDDTWWLDNHDDSQFDLDPRAWAIDMIDDGVLTHQHIAECALRWLSPSEFGEMLDANELSPRFIDN